MTIEWKRDRESLDIAMGRINSQVNIWAKGSRILDLGGGSGWVISETESDRRVVVDLDLPSLKQAKVEPVYGNLLHLPFADVSFDVVVARGVLHHVPEHLPEALDEVYRVLKEGGILFVHDPGGLNPP